MPIWKKWRSLFRNRIALLATQAIVLVACVGYVAHVYYSDILPDKVAADTYQEASCFLISKKLSTSGFVMERYRADFLVTYNVNHVQYTRWVSGNGLDQGYSRGSAEKKDSLVRFDVGFMYPCWYNPEHPESVYLVARSNWVVVLPLFLPLALIVITLYYFLKNLFYLIDGHVVRSRQKRKRD